MVESEFKKNFFRKLHARCANKHIFPVVLRVDTSQHRSYPDHIVLVDTKWAALEFKKAQDANHQPNQEYYVELFNEKSFARFVYPENEEEVLNELEELFQS